MILFPLGKVVITQGAAHLRYDLVSLSLHRHSTGQWGATLCSEDRMANDAAVRNGERIISEHIIGSVKVWIITEADRSVTTILLPEEY